MNKILFFLSFLLQTAFAGGYIDADKINDEPVEHGISYWILLIWFCFWGWLSSHYTMKKDNKKADLCGYICLGVPFFVLICLFIRSVFLKIF